MRYRRLFFAPLLAMALAGGFVSAAAAGVLITIDKAAQRMSVKVDGEQRYTWPVSTGRPGYATPVGSFTPFRLEEDHYSKEWDDAPMPHSVFFTREGHAIHGSYDIKKLGAPASSGCVRLAPPNAATLFALVKTEGLNNTKVVISGQEPPPAPAVAKRQPREDEPMVLHGDANTGRTPADTNGARVWPDEQAEDRRLEAYTQRMRRRYYNDRLPDERAGMAPTYSERPRYYYIPRGYGRRDYYDWN